jgi:hypothetical protein
MKLLALNEERTGMARAGGDEGGNLTNVQCQAIQNCHNESSLYNEYLLIKMKKNKTEWGQIVSGQMNY